MISLLDHAKRDYGSASFLYDGKVKQLGEDIYVNDVCYHIQQCVEKCLKFMIENKNHEYTRTHDIFELSKELLVLLGDSKLDKDIYVFVGEDILNNARAYTSWEADSRYNVSFGETASNIEKGFNHCETLISLCEKIKESSVEW